MQTLLTTIDHHLSIRSNRELLRAGTTLEMNREDDIFANFMLHMKTICSTNLTIMTLKLNCKIRFILPESTRVVFGDQHICRTPLELIF